MSEPPYPEDVFSKHYGHCSVPYAQQPEYAY